MFKNKNLIIFIFEIFSRFCWAGLIYSFVGLVLGFLNYNDYIENVDVYVIGLTVCLFWLLIFSALKGNIYENNKLD